MTNRPADAADNASREFLDTGLDESLDGEFTDAEREAVLDWYRRTHGMGDLRLVKFAPFLIDHLPGAFRRARREALIASRAPAGGAPPLPDVVIQLCYMHTYAALPFPEGILYEMISARELGAGRQLIMDVLNYAYLSAGPRGMTAVAESSGEYLRSWEPGDGAGSITWPDGWGPDPVAFQAGIDYATPQLSDGELRRISAWHQRMYGTVPRHVELFGRLHPEAFKLQRVRYERAIGHVIPAQLPPLMTLQLATIRYQPAVMRQAVHQARVLGVRRDHVFRTIGTGLRGLSIEPAAVEAVAEVVDDLLAGWEP